MIGKDMDLFTCDFTTHDSNHYLLKDGFVGYGFLQLYVNKKSQLLKIDKPKACNIRFDKIRQVTLVNQQDSKSFGAVLWSANGAIIGAVATGGLGALFGGLAGYYFGGNKSKSTIQIDFFDGTNVLITISEKGLDRILDGIN